MEKFKLAEGERALDVADFKGVYGRNIHRKGAGDLMEWLESTDFFTAPAGMKHHGAYPGGLVRHSMNVYRELRREYISTMTTRDAPGVYIPWPEEEEALAICGLLHDVCKAGVYHLGEDGAYTFRDPFPLGHGEKSVYLLSTFIDLTDEEALAIRWHMGAYDEAAKGGSRDLDAAMSFCPLVYALHAADMRAAQGEKRLEAENGRQA